MNVDIGIKEDNARFLALIAYSLLNIGLFAFITYFDYLSIKNQQPLNLGFITFNIIFFLLISLSLNFTVSPLLKSIIRKFRIKDDYLNQLRINQELNNIELAKRLRGNIKRPNTKFYSDSVKMHLGIRVSEKKKISFWKKMFHKNKKPKKSKSLSGR
ncbi:MAG: hypothetical protein PHH00_02610 [Candidatus Nanoarchaeia archaeon]|nr:hypothetical protein [Candidatus Nanoarchaeia archaeon]